MSIPTAPTLNQWQLAEVTKALGGTAPSQELLEVINGLLANQHYMHLAYRPEVVAEVAVYLGAHEDWEEIAKWCGGRIVNSQDPSGEYSSSLVLPNGKRGGEWAWLVLDHAGEFSFRAEVKAPSVASATSGDGATSYVIADSPKMLRETLCIAQTAVSQVAGPGGAARVHLDRLQRLIDECDRHRPLGSDGKHGDRHTTTCGCDR